MMCLFRLNRKIKNAFTRQRDKVNNLKAVEITENKD